MTCRWARTARWMRWPIRPSPSWCSASASIFSRRARWIEVFMPPRLMLRDIALFERPVPFVRPFRFGAVTIHAPTQFFVRVEIDVEGKGGAVGAGAELLAPKWFDKRPHLSSEKTATELRRSLGIARDLYL